MSKFNIGDIVGPGKKADNRYSITNSNMKKAKVIGIKQDSIEIRVVQHEDDSAIGNEYWVDESYFEKARKNNETIVIFRKGNTVIATDKSTGKTAQATCMDSDTFNLADGQKLAFYRLMGTPEEKIREMLPHLFEKDETEMQEEIKAGDEVEVVNVGKTYDTYSRWKGLGKYVQNFVRFAIPTTKDRYIVLNVKEHGAKGFDNFVALIQNPKTTQVFIVDVAALRRVEK